MSFDERITFPIKQSKEACQKTVITIFGFCPKYKVKDNSAILSDSSFDDSSVKSLSLSDIDV